MVIGETASPKFLKEFSEGDIYIEHRDYYNDVLVETEYNIVKEMYYVSSIILARRVRNREKCIYIDSPYKSQFDSSYIPKELEKFFRYKTGFLDRMIYRQDSPYRISDICNELWDKSNTYLIAANNAFLLSLSSVWDYTSDANIDRYASKASLYKCLAISWIHRTINSLKEAIDFQNDYGTKLNPTNLPDLLKHDKLIHAIDWKVIQPLIEIQPKQDDFTLTF